MDSLLPQHNMARVSNGLAKITSTTPCRFFARGHCARGNTCHFTHDAPMSKPAPGPASAIPSTPTTTRIPCRFFASGSCTKGTACSFEHAERLKETLLATQSVFDLRASKPCSFFAQGACMHGTKCAFSHADTAVQEKVAPHLRGPAVMVSRPSASMFVLSTLTDRNTLPQEEKTRDDWKREFGGSLVEFAQGASIKKITLPSDFSAVRLTGLPRGSCPETVVALLSEPAMSVSPADVRMLPNTNPFSCSAEVRIEDPMFASNVCKKVNNHIRADKLQAVSIPVQMPRGSTVNQVDSGRVHCSWHRQTREASLNYKTWHHAQQVRLHFSIGEYKLFGKTLRASGPEPACEHGKPDLWAVTLYDLPVNTRAQHIEQVLPACDHPQSIDIGEASYNTGPEASAAIVKSMLAKIGPLESWELSPCASGKRFKAQAKFQNEVDAHNAAEALNDRVLPFHHTARLTVQLVTSAKFKVASRIHDALRDELVDRKGRWGAHEIYFVAHPPQQGHRMLKLEGQDGHLVAEAKKLLEKLIAGKVMRRGGKDVWHPSFARSDGEFKRLKKLEAKHDVVILRDIRRSQLRVVGPSGSVRKVADDLDEFLRDKDWASQEVFELTTDEFQWACRGGFDVLKARLGADKATFDSISTPKRIIVGGTSDDIALATSIIASKQTQCRAHATRESRTADCSACWTEAEDPVRVSCGHIYCADCFANLCQAAVSSTSGFRLCCVGDENRCGKGFSIEELQELLSSAALEDLLEASFTSHVRQHPADFRCCPTPDCKQIYRPAAEGAPASTFTCADCLISVCTGCNASHPRMTCGECEDSGLKAFAEAKRGLGIKDCPKCKVAIEKADGCNHVTCLGCKTHICWKCLKTFDNSTACYNHLKKAHGGYWEGFIMQ